MSSPSAANCCHSSSPFSIAKHSPFAMATSCIAASRSSTQIKTKPNQTKLSIICVRLGKSSSSCPPETNPSKYIGFPYHNYDELLPVDPVWSTLRREAQSDVEEEPVLEHYYYTSVLSHASLESALAYQLAAKLGGPNSVSGAVLQELLLGVFSEDPAIGRAIRADLRVARDRDPACSKMVRCLLYYKGFLACQAHRAAHKLWKNGRQVFALFLQNRVSEVFAVDIHPGARIGSGILLDHATGLVVGETAVIGDNVSILHNVTLGGTGKECGDRHPKIGDGVLVGAGTHILGNVRIGAGAKIGAGSVVLKEVPPRTTAVGNPAKLIGGKENPIKCDKMPSLTMDHTSWSDYVI